MRYVRKAAAALTLAVLVCMALAAPVFAAESGRVWVEPAQDGSNAALIVTDTTVTDGLVKLTYDSSKLTYEGIEVTDAYVAMYAVNDEQAGVLLISWVAPEAYETNGETVCLIRVNFSGTEEGDVANSGEAHDGQGNDVTVGNGTEEPGDETNPTEEPSDGTDPTEKPGGNENGGSADTGDSSQVWAFVCLGGLAMTGCVMLPVLMNQKKGRC